eukprot:930347-Pyramimonas_sp.AAC.1
MCGSSILLYYNPAAQRLDCRPTSIPRSITTRSMNTTGETFHTPGYVEGMPYVKMISDGFTSENNQWVFGWMSYHRG